jgi:uncharacterized protein YciI
VIWAIWCRDADNVAEIRARVGKDHSAYLTNSRFPVLMAGPLIGDDGNGSVGSLLLIEAESREDAKSMVDGDPFAVNGVWGTIDIQPYRMSRKNL